VARLRCNMMFKSTSNMLGAISTRFSKRKWLKKLMDIAHKYFKSTKKLAFCGVAFVWCTAAYSAPQKPGFVQVELVAEHTTATPGKPLWIGLRMQHDAGWHTYWKNPGDAGLPTTLNFTLPAGYRTGPIEWPHPQRIVVKQLASYGYEGDLLLPLLLFVPKQASGKMMLSVKAEWLVCKESCIPEAADLQLTLPVAAQPASSPHAPRFAAARAALPQPIQGATAQAVRDNGRLVVELMLPAALRSAGELFLDREDVVEPGPTPQVRVLQDRVQWSSALTAGGKQLAAPARLPAVWVPREPAAEQPRAVRVQVELAR
jgi:DsbC/DsbD-like thiol-disulfide interchange protein